MSKPLLQIALDTLTIEEAIENVEKVKNEIDVIEVGTILISAIGKKAIGEIAKKYPDKIIVADGKIADAGSIFGKMFFQEGATFTTTICAAETATMKAVLEVAKTYGNDKDVQVELTSHYNWKQVNEWKQVGIKQVVYHRSRDAQTAGIAWTDHDLNEIKKLANSGFKVTITGGITIEDIKIFRGIPIYIFIAGRSIRNASDPLKMAKEFQKEFRKYW